MTIPVAGVPLTITRTYDSRIKTKEDFGYGWTLGMSVIGSVQHNRKPGDGWRISKPVGFFLPCSRVEELKSHVTEVRLGERTYFRFKPVIKNVAGGFGFCDGDLTFEQTGGTRPGAKLQLLGRDTWVFNAEGRTDLRNWDDLDVEAATDVRLTTPEGNVIDLNVYKGVTRFQDRNGNSVSVGPNGLTHNLGIGLPFERDAEGRITKITDPMGYTVRYRYDGNGNLVRFEDQEGNGTQFTYLASIPHQLLDVIDPLGVRALRAEYGADGRLAAIIDSMERRSERRHDLDNRAEFVTDRLGYSTLLRYNRRGNVVERLDPTGARWVRRYDESDNMIFELDPVSRTSTMTYDSRGNLTELVRDGSRRVYTYSDLDQETSATNEENEFTSRTYDIRGNLVAFQDRNGATTKLLRDARGMVGRIVGPNGTVVRTLEYDTLGRLTWDRDAAGNEIRTDLDRSGRVVCEVYVELDDRGHTTSRRFEYRRDARGRIAELVHPDGSVLTTQRDAAGRRTGLVTRLGDTFTFSFDTEGNQTGRHFPDGTSTTAEYDAEGRVLAREDEEGNRTSFEYGPSGWIVAVGLPGGERQTVTHDAMGRPTVVRNFDGSVATATYGPDWTETSGTHSATSRTEFDKVGRPVRIFSMGEEAAIHYDVERGRRVVSDSSGRSSQASYDQVGRLIAVRGVDGSTTSFAYDDVGRLILVASDATGNSVEYRYRGMQLSAIEDPNGNVASLRSDPVARTASKTLPSGSTFTYAFDAAGRLRRYDGPQGARVDYAHNLKGLVATRTLGSGEVTMMTYTPAGRRETSNDEFFEYDARGRLVRNQKPSGATLSYLYDSLGNLAQTVGPAGVQKYSYDTQRRLEGVEDASGREFGLGYDGKGRLGQFRYPNGAIADYGYDDFGLARLTITTEEAIIGDYSYVRDESGVIRSVSDTVSGEAVRYEYDSAGRVIDAVETEHGLEVGHRTYEYDAAGNRTGSTDGATRYEYQHDGDGRLTAISDGLSETTYSYDEAGNIRSRTKAGTTTYFGFDDLNQLRSIRSGPQELLFSYDSDGIRDGVSRNGVPSILVVDKRSKLSRLVARTTSSGDLVESYLWAGSVPVAHTSSTGGVSTIHVDRVGSVRFLMNEGAQVTDRYSYHEFGEMTHVGASLSKLGFLGEESDPESGLIYLRARYLDPSTGRFLTRDPESGVATRSMSLNPYVYAEGDPVNRGDPTGRSSIGLETQIALSIQAQISNQSALRALSPIDMDQVWLSLEQTYGPEDIAVFVDEMATTGFSKDVGVLFGSNNAETVTQVRNAWGKMQEIINSPRLQIVPCERTRSPSCSFFAGVGSRLRDEFYPTFADDPFIRMGDAFVRSFSWDHVDTNAAGQSIEWVMRPLSHPLLRVVTIMHELTHFAEFVGAGHGRISLAPYLDPFEPPPPPYTQIACEADGRCLFPLTMTEEWVIGFARGDRSAIVQAVWPLEASALDIAGRLQEFAPWEFEVERLSHAASFQFQAFRHLSAAYSASDEGAPP
ncbi:MAG: RHS repeat protein [Deltaproteobacteria bacterium]|nr:RHS repeat protein [Deltaproteobacteria bacterium]